MNTKTTITDLAAAHHPAKPLQFLEKALRLGLTVEQTHNLRTDGTSEYTITSPTNPAEIWEVWVLHTSGRNGGKLDLVRYQPHSAKGRHTKKLTRSEALATIDTMGDSLARQREREALKADRDAHTADLNAATVQEPAHVIAEDDMRDVTEGVRANQVEAIVGRLNRHGRVALRLVRDTGPARGQLPHATPGKLRGAFARWGLIDTTGTLTDLGRAARSLVLA